MTVPAKEIANPTQSPSAACLFWQCLPARPLAALALTLGLYMAVLVPRLLWIDPKDGLVAADLKIWGDWPFHIAMIRRFAEVAPWEWLSQHPMIGGEPLRYPFVSSLISGLLMRMGFSVVASILIPTFIAFALLLPGMLALYQLLLGGKWRSLIAVFLFFCAAGPGSWEWLKAFRLQPSWDLLLNPPHDYSMADKYEWYSSNFLSAMLLPQRAFLLGLTVGVWLLVALFYTFTYWDVLSPRLRVRLLAGCGLCGGLMPILHMHSLFAIAILSLFAIPIFAGRSWERWRAVLLAYAIPGLILAAAMYKLFIAPLHPYPDFVSWRPGLNAHDGGLHEWVKMWWQFWGLSLPLALLALIPILPMLSRRDWRIGVFLGGFALFVIANLIQFQPIPWDNSKLFLWVYLCLSGLLANLLADIGSIAPWVRFPLRSLADRPQTRLLLRTAAATLFVVLTATGMLCLIRLQRIDKNQNQILCTDDLRRGDRLRAITSPDSVVLCEGYIAHWVMTWAGRPIFMGFGGWMSNFAYNADSRNKDRDTIYAGGPEAERLLIQDRIDYVVIGGGERRAYKPNDAWFDQHYPVILRDGDNVVYRTGHFGDSASGTPRQ